MQQYRIKGDDGAEYGPSSAAEIREWIIENRVGGDTLISLEDEQPQWKPCESFPEFAAFVVEKEADVTGLGPGKFPLASFVTRALAFMLDSILISIMALIAFEALNMALPIDNRIDLNLVVQVLHEDAPPTPLGWVIWAITLSAQIIYNTYFIGRYGRTLGKKFFRIRVVNMQGLTPGYSKALVRALGSLISQMPFFIGYFFFFLTPLRRTFHDIAAGTAVVQDSK